MRKTIEAAGFTIATWDDVTAEAAGPSAGGAAVPAHAAPRIIMGDGLEAIQQAGQRNREEQRIVMFQVVARR